MVEGESLGSSSDQDLRRLARIAEPVLNSDAVQRLGRVTFLGVLARTRYETNSARGGSRLDHSASVACIALDIAEHLELNPLATKYAAAWGLLHDVATWPLSHTSEPAFVDITGITARTLREMMVTGDRRLPERLHVKRELHEMGVEPTALLALFAPKPVVEPSLRILWQLIRSALTPDTLEGMARTGEVFGVQVPEPSTIWSSLRRELFDLTMAPSGWTAAIKFWDAKATIYSKHINRRDVICKESTWSQSIAAAFQGTQLVASIELEEAQIFKQVRQLELPSTSNTYRYKSPLAYYVNTAARPARSKQAVEVTCLNRVLAKAPLAKAPLVKAPLAK